MDRAVLEQMLGEGLSLAEIGRRVERHEATVSYWVKRHGLRAAHSDMHAPKGRLQCANCHAEVESGVATLAARDWPALQSVAPSDDHPE
ncbi:MAG: helix-turn-helix domain-containing protein [Solirubrobacteraceae bacterium]